MRASKDAAQQLQTRIRNWRPHRQERERQSVQVSATTRRPIDTF